MSKKKDKKKFISIAIIISFLVIIGIMIFYVLTFFNTSDNTQTDIIKCYQNNKKIFICLAEYIKNKEDNIYIKKIGDKEYEIYTLLKDLPSAKINIDDNNAKNNIRTVLFKKNFKLIYEEGNSIYFQKEAFLQSDSGLVFSKDGSKPDWPNLTILKNIEGNWYYYSSN